MPTPRIISPSDFPGGTDAMFSNSIAQSSLAGFSSMHSHFSQPDMGNSQTNWRGGSGKIYSLTEVSVDDFILEETHLYMLVSQETALWIGTARDLIEDSASRIQFRQNSKFATKAYAIPLPPIEEDKIQMVGDLTSGRSISKRHAA